MIILLALVFAVTFAVYWAFYIEPDTLTVTRLTITDPDLPAAWDGRVIAFFSDTHVGPTFDAERMSRVADAIVAAEPDLILFGGDMVDHRTPEDAAFTEAISACLARMQAPLGQYAIVGNHDNYLLNKLHLAEKILTDGGFQMLINQSLEVDGLLLGGMDESYFGQPSLAKTFPNTAEQADRWRILLVHQPDYAAELFSQSADLILSGHSHNGQIALFGMPIHSVYQGKKYHDGLYKLAGSCQIVVSRGLGTIGVAARFGASPEVVLITLQRG